LFPGKVHSCVFQKNVGKVEEIREKRETAMRKLAEHKHYFEKNGNRPLVNSSIDWLPFFKRVDAIKYYSKVFTIFFLLTIQISF